MTPKPPYAPTKLPGGVARLIQVWEDLRVRNTDGYLPGIGGILANIKQHGSVAVCRGTTCTPFSATVIGVAFDPTYPRDDWPNWQNEITMPSKAKGDPYVPMFNGGKDPMLPFNVFYVAHNSNGGAVKSVLDRNLGVEVDSRQMRRGDLVEINWWNGGGHGVFCWDVHLNAAGEVDCIQIIGSNGPSPGVSIHGCKGKPWLEGTNAKDKRGTGDYKKAKDKIFVDDDAVVQQGGWYGLPGVTAIDLDSFRVRPAHVLLSKQKANWGYTIKSVRCARFHYDEAPPAPQCMKDPNAPPPPKTPPGHVDGPTTRLRGKNIAGDPIVLQQTRPKPVQQDQAKPTPWQLEVEQAMQQFFTVGWITTDPGKPDGINDAKTQAAVKDYQDKLHLQVDGIAGNETRTSLRLQLPASHRQHEVQEQLARLFRGKQIGSDPGPATGIHNAATKAAVQEFQGLVGLDASGLPDAETQVKLREFLAQKAPTTEQPGLEPTVQHLYWVGNSVVPGGTATLRLHCRDLLLGQACPIELQDEASGVKVAAPLPILVFGETAEAAVPVPPQFGANAKLRARVVANIGGDGTLETVTAAPLYVRGLAATEPADWRAYIRKGELPAAVVEAIARNRARYPRKTMQAARGGPNNSYQGPHKFDYKPTAAHTRWAKDYFAKKVEQAPPAQRNAARAFVVMLNAEGRPASLQTYDNQIVTWGVGLGAKGDGVHAFEQLNKDAAMKHLLDDLGIQYFGRDYHIVDLRSRTVVSSAVGKKGDDNRHIVALEAWRQQPDLLSAIIGMSEDPATREAVAESQYAVYLANSASWPGQDKVFTLALYFMIAHMFHWMPAIAKYGFDVGREFEAIGGGTPSLDTDAKLAPRIARAFAAKAQSWFAKRPAVAADIRTRTRTRLWKKLREDGKAEGLVLGELTYDD